MSKEIGRSPRSQFILITTDSPSECDKLKSRLAQKSGLRNEPVERKLTKSKDNKEYHVNEKESSSSRLMCSICLNTRCQKCLKQTDNENHADSCPGFHSQNKCPRCYRLFDEPRINSGEVLKDAKVTKEVRNIATQDSRMLLSKSDDKVVQTSKTDIANMDLLKLVLKLSDCPCKKTFKTDEGIEEMIKEKYKETDVGVSRDCYIETDQMNDEQNIEFEEPAKLIEPYEPKVKSKTSNLVATNVCQISFGKSVEYFHDNESRCTVVNCKSEQTSEKRLFDVILKSKSSSVPQMKIEELKRSLRDKNKPKDTIEEVNRMFANVRKNESSESGVNRPSTRNGPRILPVVKSPEQQTEEMRKGEESGARVCQLKTSQHCRHQKSEVKKCIYTLCCRHKHFDHEICCQGDQKNKRRDNVCHCHHGNERSGYNDESAHEFNSAHTSSTFS